MIFALLSMIFTAILIIMFIFWDKILDMALGGNWLLKIIVGTVSQTCCIIIIALAVIVTFILLLAKK